jgi:hypothetical protein
VVAAGLGVILLSEALGLIQVVGIGAGGGSGTLNFKGRNYRLSIGGINVGTIGASVVDLVGTASNLRTAADIVGT